MHTQNEIVTHPDEVLNAIIIAVMAIGILLILVLLSIAVEKYKSNKLTQYVKEQKERIEAEEKANQKER